jgi:hypothetical protein
MWFGDEYEEKGTVPLTIEQFVYLLDRWQHLRAQQVSQIIINYENSILTVTSPEEN